MHQPFDALFDFNEAAVVSNVGDLAEHACLRRVTAREILPRIVAQLLHAQRYALTFAIELQDLDVDFLANLNNLGRMLDALPGHVGDVQQTIDAAEVDERTVVGQVLDDTLDGVAFLQLFQQRLALRGVLVLDNRTSRHDDVVALLVQLDDLELEALAFEIRRITNRTNVNQ